MSESSWRRRMRAARAQDPDATARLLDELGTEDRDAAEIEADHRMSRLEAMREYQPGATLQEELRLRLSGPEAERGALRFQWGNALLDPVERAVSKAAGTPVELEVTGLSRGSTVVHARPVVSVAPDPESLGGPVPTAADKGVRAFAQLLTALEEENDVREWAQLFDSVDALSKALDRLQLNLGLTWYAADGGVRQADLTQRGVQYAKRLQATRDDDQEFTISGHITELRSSGVVKVKSGVAQNATAYDVRVEPDQLFRMRLVLGDNVHFRVRFRRKLDAVGRTRVSEYYFLDVAAAELTLDVDIDPPSA
ncbi:MULTISPECIES: hypothetical protein [unclassified Streptomyces]|uniref:hypothetical protein n=1 Tax=unclassified Streptomyces TaxID=2593676 RepID=UPI002E2B4A4C|nr:hypothetical protein [Streptomyces sp. NBC_01423]WSX92711.1 hypothetical protein OH827_20240 [Streptomyces sp. NBC_00891]WSY07188.1 hypothetical protein OG464_20240 [Streptomyces sp. NBC_00890]WSZ08815.1 hypothetical protein OG704_20245 [Streptomyces sp. NBC_00869]WSZ23687.1 hypothetical protein OG498_13325 [Streptomyces sp. NBC_00870]